MDVLEWKSRSAYALTEFVVFMIGALIFAAMLSSLGLLFCHFRNSKKRRRRVKRLHRFLIKTVFSGGDKLVRILYPNERKESKQLLTVKTTRGKIAVHVYFTLLSGLVAFWYLTVFANTAIYRKTGHCHDLHVSDTDLSCFLVSDRNVPPEVQEIIDEGGGELVNCQRVHQFLMTTPNITYDLEVICYAAQLNPFSAMGIAYGSCKTVSYVLQLIFKGFLFFAARGRILRVILIVLQVLFITLMLLFLVIVPSTLHLVDGLRNTPVDILRGEPFVSFSAVVLLGLSTVVVAGLTPWWAYYPINDDDSGNGGQESGGHGGGPQSMEMVQVDLGSNKNEVAQEG